MLVQSIRLMLRVWGQLVLRVLQLQVLSVLCSREINPILKTLQQALRPLAQAVQRQRRQANR